MLFGTNLFFSYTTMYIFTYSPFNYA